MCVHSQHVDGEYRPVRLESVYHCCELASDRMSICMRKAEQNRVIDFGVSTANNVVEDLGAALLVT